MVLVLLYFFNGTIKLREKICTIILFVFLIIGYWIAAINVAWHGFAHPVGFPYRNSFLFSFLILFIGYAGFVRIKDGFKKRNANLIVIIFLLYSTFLIFIRSNYVGIRSILITGLTVAVVLILLVALNEKNRYVVPAVAGLFVLQMTDGFLNSSASLDAYFEDKYAEEESLDSYKEYIDTTQALVDYVNAQDSSFFRMDKLFRRTHNDPMMFAYNGLSHFSSCETDQVKTFMGRMGFRNNVNWAYYGDASTSFADCFMGVKYLLSQYDETAKPYKWLYTENKKRIFSNPYALSIGFGMDESVKKLNMEEKDPFILQNEIASCFTHTNYQIYRPVKVEEIRLNNVTENDHEYSKIDTNQEASVEYILSVTSNNFIYMYIDDARLQNATLIINGDNKGDYFSEYEWSVREVGYFEPGEQISVKIILDDDSIRMGDAYFYYESKKVLKAWYKDAVSTTCNIKKLTSSHLTADVNVRDSAEYLVFSIPYEDDWTVRLDGKKVKPVQVMDALMAVRITGGEHILDLRYVPKGFVVGMPVTILSLITTFCVVFIKSRKKPQDGKNSSNS